METKRHALSIESLMSLTEDEDVGFFAKGHWSDEEFTAAFLEQIGIPEYLEAYSIERIWVITVPRRDFADEFFKVKADRLNAQPITAVLECPLREVGE